MALIYLIGARGSGKTTVGLALAKELGCPFIDLDAWVCEKEGKSVEEIVAESGWDGFRQKEMEHLLKATEYLQNAPSAIMATGGGIVLTRENRHHLSENGVVVWLKGSPELLMERLRKNPLNSQRPSLTGKGAIEEMAEVCKNREQMYMECATHIIDASMPTKHICGLIRRVCHL